MKIATKGFQLKMFESKNTNGREVKIGNSISPNVKTRRLKTQYGNYANSYRRFPVIRLAGHWLSTFNFQIGEVIELQVEKDHIQITKVNKDLLQQL